MPYFDHENVSLHYEIHGEGRPVLLLHGGAVSFRLNYEMCGWVRKLTSSGARVIGLDFRGHGQSAKLYDPTAYGPLNLAGDVRAFLEYLKLDQVSMVGYSLGSRIALQLLSTNPTRFSRACLVATGDGLIGASPFTFDAVLPQLVEALSRTEYPDDLPKHVAAYWQFVAESGGDREAILACTMANYPSIHTETMADVPTPVLVVSGECDLVLGQGPALARSFPGGSYVEIAGANHFDLATNATAQETVIDFLLGGK